MKAQGSTSLGADPVGAIQKCGVQHYQGEDNVRSVEDAVEYVRKTVGYEQVIFGKTIYSKAIYGKAIFGKAIYSKTIYGKAIFGKAIYGK